MGGMPKGGPKRGQRRGARQAAKSGAVGRLPEYYFSAQHPDFQQAEREFIGFNYSYAPTALDLDELDKLEERLRDDAEADSAVFDAITLLDLDALHSGQEHARDPQDVAAAFLTRLDESQFLIWKRIERRREARCNRDGPRTCREAAQESRQRVGGKPEG